MGERSSLGTRSDGKRPVMVVRQYLGGLGQESALAPTTTSASAFAFAFATVDQHRHAGSPSAELPAATTTAIASLEAPVRARPISATIQTRATIHGDANTAQSGGPARISHAGIADGAMRRLFN